MQYRRSKQTPHRSLVWAAGVGPILAGLLVVSPMSYGAPADPPRQQAADAAVPVAAESLRNVPTPPGVEEEAVLAPTGPAAARLRQTLDEVIAQFPPLAIPPAQADQLAADVPLAAQIAYARGREAWHAQRGTDALRNLQAAQRIAPKEPAIARLLGKVYAALGNRGQAALFLDQAVRLDPTDIESMFILGAIYSDQGNAAKGIPVLVAALDALRNDDTADPSLDPVIRFALARALDEAGYAAAAITQYEAVYSQPLMPDRSTQFARNLYEIDQSRTTSWVRIGDAYQRLGQPREALAAYQTAAGDDDEARSRLLPRLLYAQLRLGDEAQAQRTIIDAMLADAVTAEELASLRYVAEHVEDRSRMAQQLRKVYEGDPQNEQLALAMVSLLSADEGLALLREHVTRHPDDVAVYRQVIDRSMKGAAANRDNQQALVRLALKLIAEHPDKAASYELVISDGTQQKDLLAAVDALDEADRATPAAQYLRASLLAQLDRDDDAIAAFRLAAADDKLMAAKVSLTQLLVANKRFDEASQYLDGLANAKDPQIALLRVQVLARSGQVDKAIELLDSLIADRPDNTIDLVLEKAGLLAGNQDIEKRKLAETTLLDALDTNPDSERLFQALFNLYDSSPDSVPNVAQRRDKLLSRLVSLIPDSRLGKVKRAQSLMRSNDPNNLRQAEALLRELVVANPRDYEAFRSWMTLMVITDRMPQALEAIEIRLRENPDDIGMLTTAQGFYRDIGDQAKLYEVTERILLLSEPSLARSGVLAEIYLRTEKYDKALPLLMEILQDEGLEEPRPYLYRASQALVALNRADEFDGIVEGVIERFPDQKMDLQLLQASHYARVGNRDRAEAIKVAILKDHPDHAPTNNDLGYTWADRGVNLKEAERMIAVALAAEPGNMAYLDSMGWVLYKQGKFGEAIVYLNKSVAAAEEELKAGNTGVLGTLAVVTDHLGDAYYRNNDQAKAVQLWARALQFLRNVQVKDDPELHTLGDRLQAKIEARNNAPVAPVPAVDIPAIAPEEGVPAAPR
jgi:tetratricopeptide (TPR) repeat protein